MGELADEFALRSAVAFAEGMKGIQFAKIVRGALAESGGAKSGEALFVRELLEDRSGGALDVSVMGEKVIAPADVDCSQFSRPFVYVTEQVTVNGLEVGKVK